MNSAVIAKAVNREPKSFVMAFCLDGKPMTSRQVEIRCGELLGQDADHIRLTYPGLSRMSVQGYFNYSFRELVKGNSYEGYELNAKGRQVKESCMQALKVVASTGKSLHDILKEDKSSPIAVGILETAVWTKNSRIEDLHRTLGFAHTAITNNAQRLANEGLVTFEQLEKIEYNWNKTKTVDDLEDYISPTGKKLKAHQYRAWKVAKVLVNKEEALSASQLHATLGYEGSSLNCTDSALRLLEEKGFAVPSNCFRGGVRLTQINITEEGRKFVREWEHIKKGCKKVDLDEAMCALDLYESHKI